MPIFVGYLVPGYYEHVKTRLSIISEMIDNNSDTAFWVFKISPLVIVGLGLKHFYQLFQFLDLILPCQAVALAKAG